MADSIRELAHSFKTDAYHNLVFAEGVKKHYLYPRNSMRTKVLVMLQMSMECSLKCLYLSKNGEQDFLSAYSVIKKAGHTLSSILAIIGESSLKPELEKSLRRFNLPGIKIRYVIEWRLKYPSQMILQDYPPELKEDEMENAFALARDVYAEINEIYRTTYTGTEILDIDNLIDDLTGFATALKIS